MSPLYGLVLAGGVSSRMGEDKAALQYHGQSQLSVAFDLLSAHVERCFVSVRPAQDADPLRAQYPRIVDQMADAGPAAGLLAAHEAYPQAAWLALACDLPMLDEATLSGLIAARDGAWGAVSYSSEFDSLPEPLCAIWEPAALDALARQVSGGKICPRKCLINSRTRLLTPVSNGALDNINTPQERMDVTQKLAHSLEQKS